MKDPISRILKTINRRIKFSKQKSEKSEFVGSIFLSDASDTKEIGFMIIQTVNIYFAIESYSDFCNFLQWLNKLCKYHETSNFSFFFGCECRPDVKFSQFCPANNCWLQRLKTAGTRKRADYTKDCNKSFWHVLVLLVQCCWTDSKN